MDRNGNRENDLDRQNRENQVPGVRREEPMHGSPSQGDRSKSDTETDRNTRDAPQPGDELRGGGPDRGGILNDERDGTNRNQTGSNVNDERSRPTGSPADDRTDGS